MQRHLIPPPPYEPLPTGPGHYVPVLQSRKGELTALAHAEAAVWQRTTPLIEIVKYRDIPSADSLKAAPKRVRVALGDRPVYLDVKNMVPDASVATPTGQQPALRLLHAAARARELSFMPVAWTTSTSEHFELVAETADADGHGLALRHRFGDRALVPGVTIEDVLRDCLAHLAAEPATVDLLLDLEYLDVDGDVSVTWLAATFNRIAALAPWRSLILVATSMPASFGGGLVAEDTLGALPRPEWAMWDELSRQIDRPVAYGDYAVQNPVPPPDPPPVGPWANVRYTTNDALLISRGRNIRTTEDTQYVQLCRRLTNHPDFRGRDFSYGDGEIQRWSENSTEAHSSLDFEEDSSSELSSQQYWRGVGTSHHLAQVTQQLAER